MHSARPSTAARSARRTTLSTGLKPMRHILRATSPSFGLSRKPVRMNLGHSAVMWMPEPESSWSTVRENSSTNDFVAEYTESLGWGMTPAMDARLMMREPAAIWGSAR